MAPFVAIINSVGALMWGRHTISASVIAQADQPGEVTEANNAFLDFLNDMTDLITELFPGVDLDALGPFSGWLPNIIVLIATVLAGIAVVQIIWGLGEKYVMSGGKKEKMKQGQARISSGLTFLMWAVGLPLVLIIIGYVATYVVS